MDDNREVIEPRFPALGLACFLAAMAVAAFGALWWLPRQEHSFAEHHARLPALAQLALGMSHFLRHNLVALALAVTAGVVVAAARPRWASAILTIIAVAVLVGAGLAWTGIHYTQLELQKQTS